MANENETQTSSASNTTTTTTTSTGSRPSTGDPNVNGQRMEIAAGTSAYPRLPIPTMTESGIDAYFFSLDYWFLASGVTNDSRKFNTVLAQVPPAKLLELKPIIDAAPENGKYEYIKEKLITHFADSRRQRLNRLLSDLPLGDKKPSQLYHEMLRTAGNTMNEPVIRDLWASRLPNYAQAAVVASSGTPEQVTKIADAIVESMGLKTIREFSSTASDARSPSNATQPEPYDKLVSEIAQLNRKFEKLFSERGRAQNRQNSNQRSQSTTRQRAATPASNAERNYDTDCWYHQRHGDRARFCRSPCRRKRPGQQANAAPAQQQ